MLRGTIASVLVAFRRKVSDAVIWNRPFRTEGGEQERRPDLHEEKLWQQLDKEMRASAAPDSVYGS